jgi:hypothetical protein
MITKWIKILAHDFLVYPLTPLMPSAWGVYLQAKTASWGKRISDDPSMTIGTAEYLADLYRVEGYTLRKNDERYIVMDKVVGYTIESITILRAGFSTTGHSHANEELYIFDNFSEGLAIHIDGVPHNAAGRIIICPNQHHRVFNETNGIRVFKCIFNKY